MLWTVHASRNPIVLYVVFNRVCVGSDGTLAPDERAWLCVAFIALVRLPSLKVSTLLLVGLLVYDVFWVSQFNSIQNIVYLPVFITTTGRSKS